MAWLRLKWFGEFHLDPLTDKAEVVKGLGGLGQAGQHTVQVA